MRWCSKKSLREKKRDKLQLTQPYHKFKSLGSEKITKCLVCEKMIYNNFLSGVQAKECVICGATFHNYCWLTSKARNKTRIHCKTISLTSENYASGHQMHPIVETNNQECFVCKQSIGG